MRNDETPEGDTPRQKAISIHSLRVEGDLQPMQKCGVLHDFNPLPPCGGRQAEMPKASATFFYFNPLPPCGGRLPAGMMAGNASYFNPLPPCGGRPLRRICGADQQRISIHSLRVEGDVRGLHEPLISQISIHSLRVEGDLAMRQGRLDGIAISIHSLRVEGDAWLRDHGYLIKRISIHSLRVEGDLLSQGCRGLARNFNPLPPCGGRRKRAARAAYIADFNPLPPCGGRPNVIVSDLLDAVFQSTPSVWRETCVGRFVYLHKIFQSTPSVWRETEALINAGAVHFRFQSTPSVWRETNTIHYIDPQSLISIHSLRVEGDHAAALQCGIFARFQSTPSVWRETLLSCCNF